MAEERIDSLSIDIVTSAERAVKGLDNIAKSTDKVGKALKNVKTSGLDKVSKDAVDSAKSIENLNSRMESLFAKGEAAGKKFFNVDDMGLKEAENKLKVLQRQYDNIRDTINTKLSSGILGGTTLENQVIQAGKLATRLDIVKDKIDGLRSSGKDLKAVDFFDIPNFKSTLGKPFEMREMIDTSEDDETYKARVAKILGEQRRNNAIQSLKAQISETKIEIDNLGEAITKALQPSESNGAVESVREFENEVDNAEVKITSLKDRFKEWLSVGDVEEPTMLEGFKNAVSMTGSSIVNFPKNIGSLLAEKTGIYSYDKDYYALQKSLSEAEAEAEKLSEAIQAVSEKEVNVDTSLSEKKLKSLNAEIGELKVKIAELEGQGKGFHLFGNIKDKLSGGDTEGTSRAFRSTGKSSNALGKGLKNVLGFMKKLVPNSKSLKSALGGLGLTNNGLSKSLLRTGKMLKLMVVRMALRGVITGAKEGFQNLIQYSDSTKASMQQLVSSLDYLKNSFAAAFAPAINVAAPILSKFIDYLVSAVNQINQLVSSLLGFSTWTKATKLASNYGNAVSGAGKAAKDLNKQLQGFDELNNLTTNQGGGSGGGSGAGTNYADMFTTEEVDGYWKSIADRIKDTWNFDDADFTWLGASLGEKISEQLDGLIDKHPKIKDNARKIGKALGTTITGFVETPNLGYKVGTVIGNAIDTAVTGLDGFVSNVHWDSVGTFIGQGINGIKDTELIHDVFTLLKNSINGAINFLWSSGNEIDFKGIGGKIGEELSEAISGLEAKKAGEAISTWIRGGLQAITEFLYKTDFEEVGQKLADFLSGIDWGGLAWDLLTCAEAIADALVDAIKALWNNQGVLGKIGLAIAGLIGFAKISSIGLNLTNATVTATGTNAVAQTLGQKLSAACTSFFGASPLTVAVSVAVSWKLGESVGKQLGNELFSAIADEDLSKYYKDFHWWGEGGFFDEVTDDIDITRDAIQNMYNDAVNYFHGDDFETTGSFAKSAIGYAKEGANKTLTKNASGDGYTGTSGKFGSSGFASILSDMTKTYDNLSTSQNKVVQGSKKIQATSSKEGKSWTSLGKLAVNGLTSIVNNENKATKSTDTFSKSYQSNSDKVTKATTGMSNNIANSRVNIIGSMDKIGLSFDGTYSKINTGADTASKSVDAKFQYMKQMATAHTEEQRKAIEAKYGQMVDTTKTNTGSMSSDVLSKFTAMNTNTSSKSQSMLDVLKKNLASMKSNTNTETSGMASTVLSKFTAMNNDTSAKSTGMLNAFKTNLASMKSNTNTETSNMQTIVSKWSTNVKNLVTNTKGTAKFDVQTPTQSLVSQKLEELKRIWGKGGEAKFSLNFGASSSSISEMANKAIEKVKQAFNNSGVSVLKNAVSKIKFFAKGGVVDKATLGIFGEAGTEAIMPLERNTEWIGKLSTQIVAEMPSLPTYQSSSNESAILEQNRLLAEQNALLRRIAEKDVSISSRDVFNAVRNENNDYVNRTGASPFFV